MHYIRHFKEPRIVHVKVDFIKLGEIDTMNENYHAEILIESKWLETEDIIEYNSDVHWNPKFVIENVVQLQHEKIKYTIKNESETSISKIFDLQFFVINYINNRWSIMDY
jgi:hypothetical protein